MDRVAFGICLALTCAGWFALGWGWGVARERAKWGLPAGDGKTDDTAAIQSMIDRAGRSEVFLPPGIYRVGSKDEP